MSEERHQWLVALQVYDNEVIGPALLVANFREPLGPGGVFGRGHGDVCAEILRCGFDALVVRGDPDFVCSTSHGYPVNMLDHGLAGDEPERLARQARRRVACRYDNNKSAHGVVSCTLIIRLRQLPLNCAYLQAGFRHFLAMMLLDILYATVFVIALPWVLFMLLTRPAFRAGLRARFRPALEPDPDRRTIWLHGSSAGEIDLLRALVEPVESLPGDHRIVISAFSISGYTVAKKVFPEHEVVYFPADFSFVVRRFLKAIDPSLIVLVESELWPNFIATVHDAGIPVCVVNARMSEKSFRKHQRIRLIPRALAKLDMIAAQTGEDADRFVDLGVDPDRLHVTGNMKYDRCNAGDARENEALRRRLREQFGIASDMPVLIGGSVHRGEDRVIVSVYKRLIDAGHELRLILVPRYPAETSGRDSGNSRTSASRACARPRGRSIPRPYSISLRAS